MGNYPAKELLTLRNQIGCAGTRQFLPVNVPGNTVANHDDLVQNLSDETVHKMLKISCETTKKDWPSTVCRCPAGWSHSTPISAATFEGPVWPSCKVQEHKTKSWPKPRKGTSQRKYMQQNQENISNWTAMFSGVHEGKSEMDCTKSPACFNALCVYNPAELLTQNIRCGTS